MLNKSVSKKIRAAATKMDTKELYNYLKGLESDGEISIDTDGWDTAYGYAFHLINRMIDALEKGEWYGYEPKALIALDEIPGDEHEVIEIDAYGNPLEISDNDHLLRVLGIADKLAE